jgi:dTMP kinase
MFITFEGLDYSGKSSQAKILVDRLKTEGRGVVFLREPGGSAISEKIRDILLDKSYDEMTDEAELFLFSAARTQLVTEVIQPALKGGKIVVCDRFFDSTTAYQGYGRGIDLDVVEAINRLAARGTTPDLTVLLHIEIEEIIRRRKAAGKDTDRMESSGKEFYERARDGFLDLAKQNPGRFAMFDGSELRDSIAEKIWITVQERLGHSKFKKIKGNS